MPGKAVISLSNGLEDPVKVTVALLVALGAAEGGRPTLMFLAKEAVRLDRRRRGNNVQLLTTHGLSPARSRKRPGNGRGTRAA